LIFLLVTSALQFNKDIPVTVPESEQSAPVENERAFEVIVDKAGVVYANGKQVNASQLQDITLNEILKFPATIFFIKGDKQTDFRHVDKVLEILKNNKIQNVVLVAKQKETE
jgi:biopolymer transport protein ExbD